MQLRILTMDQWIFAGKTCLGASVLLALVLVFRASYQPGPAAASRTSTEPVASGPTATIPTRKEENQPPRLPAECVLQIEVQVGGQPKNERTHAFCIRTSAGRSYLVARASLLTKSGWEQVTQVMLLPNRLILKQKPVYVGPYTEDHQPNMLAKPDLGLDSAWWQLEEAHQIEGLPLSQESAIRNGDTAWIASPGTNPLIRCSVMEYGETRLSVQPRERVSLEDVIGLPVVNGAGQVIGTVLGGNDLVFTGASATGMRRVIPAQNR